MKNFLILSYISISISFIFIFGCKPDEINIETTVPLCEIIKSGSYYQLPTFKFTDSFLYCEGIELVADGGENVTSKGICWSNDGTPTINDGKQIGSENFKIFGLKGGTTYYISAFATNKNGTGYSKPYEITTAEYNEDLHLENEYNITSTSIELYFHNYSSNQFDYTSDFQNLGVCWNTIGSPTISDKTKLFSLTENYFTFTITSLKPNTDYYFRMFYKSTKGVTYSNMVVASTTY
jgi:hypothetical protein